MVQKLSIPALLVAISMVTVLILTMLSGIIGTSNNPCTGGGCHGSEKWEYCNLLPSDATSSLPTTFQTGSSKNVKMAVEVTGSGSDIYYKIDTLRVTLSSSNNKVNIPSAQQQLTNLYPGNKRTFQWSVMGVDGGDDTLIFDLWADNSHSNEPSRESTFSDTHFYDIFVQDRPSQPRYLQANCGDSYVELAWQEPSTDGGLTIIKYNVYRGSSNGGETFLASVNYPTKIYNDTSVINDQTYYYYVKAENSIGESIQSNEVSATPELGATKPSPPKNLMATPGNDYIELSWDPPADNGGSPLTGYKIYSGPSSGAEEELKLLGSTLTDYQDDDVINGITYYYYVTAINIVGESEPSNKVKAAPDGTPPIIAIITPRNNSYINQNSIKVEWTSSDPGIGINYFEIKLDNANWLKIGNTTSHSYSYLSDGQHVVFLKATDKLGNYNITSVTFTVDLDQPVLEIESPTDNSYVNTSSVTVTWNGTDSLSGIDYYEIRLFGDPWVDVGKKESYTLSLFNDGDYTIEIKAVDKALNSVSATVYFVLDTTAPKIVSKAPMGENVPRESVITIVFSEEMLKSSVQISISGVDGAETWEDNELTYKPKQNLDYKTKYEVQVSGSDLAGNPVLTTKWSFTTVEMEKITGQVVDKNGKPIANATIILNNGESVTTDENGYYEIETPPGDYTVTISKDGFSETIDVTVSAGKVKTLPNIELPVTEKGASQAEAQDLTWIVITSVIIIVIVVIVALVLKMTKPKS